MKKAIFRLSILAILVGGGWFGYRSFKQSQTRQEKIATAKVQRGDVTIRAFTRGELKAVRTYSLYSPNLNGAIQVTSLAPAGALAREKNLVVEYDDSELLGTIEADKLTLDTTDENIKYQKLVMDVQTSKNEVNELLAEFAVKRAELQVQKNPVLDPITQKENILALTQATRALVQTKTNIEMLKAQQDSQMAVYNSNRRRSVQALGLDQQRLLQTKTLAPMTGLVAIKQNRAGNFNFGQQMPDIRPGDQLQAGMNVADLLDLSEMELTAKVGELDRANLKEGQGVMIQLDAIPDKRFPGKIKTLSGYGDFGCVFRRSFEEIRHFFLGGYARAAYRRRNEEGRYRPDHDHGRRERQEEPDQLRAHGDRRERRLRRRAGSWRRARRSAGGSGGPGGDGRRARPGRFRRARPGRRPGARRSRRRPGAGRFRRARSRRRPGRRHEQSLGRGPADAVRSQDRRFATRLPTPSARSCNSSSRL